MNLSLHTRRSGKAKAMLKTQRLKTGTGKEPVPQSGAPDTNLVHTVRRAGTSASRLAPQSFSQRLAALRDEAVGAQARPFQCRSRCLSYLEQ